MRDNAGSCGHKIQFTACACACGIRQLGNALVLVFIMRADQLYFVLNAWHSPTEVLQCENCRALAPACRGQSSAVFAKFPRINDLEHITLLSNAVIFGTDMGLLYLRTVVRWFRLIVMY